MVKVISQSLAVITGRRPELKRPPRHRIGAYVPAPRTHPWFELRAQRTAELGQYR
jgi:hypothetical protein